MKKIVKYLIHIFTFISGIFLVMFAFKCAKAEGYNLVTIPKLVVYLAAGHLLVIMIVFSFVKELKNKDNNRTLNTCLIGFSFFPLAHFLTLFIYNLVTGTEVLTLLSRLILSIASVTLFLLAFIKEQKGKESKWFWLAATASLLVLSVIRIGGMFLDPVVLYLSIGLLIAIIPCGLKTYLAFAK